jgi:hypothetical protein
MQRKLTVSEERIFGDNARVHPATDLPLHDGPDALSDDEQARNHLRVLCTWIDQGVRQIAYLRDAIREVDAPPAHTSPRDPPAVITPSVMRQRVRYARACSCSCATSATSSKTLINASATPRPF